MSENRNEVEYCTRLSVVTKIHNDGYLIEFPCEIIDLSKIRIIKLSQTKKNA